ncbi:hypothetical protein EJ04DRAFT_425903 [Polyplosphaeria fusca]|uniref:Uncharacterized protein n=1 Tax=Polyplosphaeria fusca TaxID=682080 RepID=A0A9P4V804_9PLEO|nr:hypothetical protein EJ04DRAFT_425903 [Polyplosphaeria fusca]
MDEDNPSASGAFNKLPIELNKMIADYIESNQDIAHFAAACRATHDAIEGDLGSFWRKRFRETYAMALGKVNTKKEQGQQNYQLRKVYTVRSKILRRGTTVSFQFGLSKREHYVLRILRDLIVESFKGETQVYDEYDRPECLNQRHIVRFILNSKLFLGLKRIDSPSSPEEQGAYRAVAAVQLMCAHFLFNLADFDHDILSFDLSQKIVYETTVKAPIFGGSHNSQINFEWILHCLNFFRSHMMSQTQATMCDAFRMMTPGEKPSAWQAPLQHGCYPLAKNWRGTYAYLDIHELELIREISKKTKKGVFNHVFMDKNIEDDKFNSLQDMSMKFYAPGQGGTWPTAFERHLHSKREPQVPRTRAQHRSEHTDPGPPAIMFSAEGEDEEHFYTKGWLNPLPPQPANCVIPGWQRITFMKYFLDEEDVGIEMDSLWAYEGVVLPGGRMMLGRWWYANNDPRSRSPENSGPFIFWAVDPDMDDMIESDNDTD